MARVPNKMYRNITQHAYTRRKYMGGVPGLRILQFQSGNKTADFPVSLHLIVEERGQIRHTALEALRITGVRFMDKKAGRDNYHLHVRVYPHHVLRQNKQASGAGADRVSMGMRLAFGKAIGTAARVQAGQSILTISTVARAIPFAKEALRKAMNKVACPCHIDVVSNDPERTVDEMIHIGADQSGASLSGAGTEDDTGTEESEGGASTDGEEATDAGEGKESGDGADGEETPTAEA
jgi:large subunit ribosomal protein L10e